MAMDASIDAQALAASLRRFERRPDGAVLQSSLQQIVEACTELFHVSGSGLMLMDEHGALRYAVSTGPGSRLLEEAQLATGEGPCIASFVDDAPTACDDVRADERWPALAGRLADGDVGAVHGVPVHLLGTSVGTLDTYCDTAHRWSGDQRAALVRFAEVAEAVITAAVHAEQAGELAQRLSYALDHRIPLERATGYLMARHRLGRPAAVERLRGSTRASGRRIGDVAADLLRTGRLPDDPA
jgi:GAF domain-containing protein